MRSEWNEIVPGIVKPYQAGLIRMPPPDEGTALHIEPVVPVPTLPVSTSPLFPNCRSSDGKARFPPEFVRNREWLADIVPNGEALRDIFSVPGGDEPSPSDPRYGVG